MDTITNEARVRYKSGRLGAGFGRMAVACERVFNRFVGTNIFWTPIRVIATLVYLVASSNREQRPTDLGTLLDCPMGTWAGFRIISRVWHQRSARGWTRSRDLKER